MGPPVHTACCAKPSQPMVWYRVSDCDVYDRRICQFSSRRRSLLRRFSKVAAGFSRLCASEPPSHFRLWPLHLSLGYVATSMPATSRSAQMQMGLQSRPWTGAPTLVILLPSVNVVGCSVLSSPAGAFLRPLRLLQRRVIALSEVRVISVSVPARPVPTTAPTRHVFARRMRCFKLR